MEEKTKTLSLTYAQEELLQKAIEFYIDELRNKIARLHLFHSSEYTEEREETFKKNIAALRPLLKNEYLKIALKNY